MPSERVQRRIEALLDDADAALSIQDWQKAAEIARAAITMDSDNADAATYLAAAEAALGDQAESVTGSSTKPVASPPVSVASEATPTSFANDRYQVSRAE